MALNRITQFAGESFNTKDNVRTVYVGQAEDTVSRPSRTIVLVGPIGAGKSSLIDFLCNYFYENRFDSDFRYKIADECFNSTTPEKAVIKYIFNGTKMPYRPIVIDTPGIGDPTGLKASRELASVVTDYFNLNSKERIHAVGLVLPNFMHSVNDQIDSDIKLTLSLFPDWMHANIVPIVTYSSQPTATNVDLLKHFGLSNNTTFCVDTGVVFASPATDPEIRRHQHTQWQLTADSVRQFLSFVGDFQPQTIEKKLLAGDATPNLLVSPPLEKAASTEWQTPSGEPINLTKSEQTVSFKPLPHHHIHHIPIEETDEEVSIREVTVITVSSGHPSPTNSLGKKNPDSSPGALGQKLEPILGQSPPGNQHFSSDHHGIPLITDSQQPPIVPPHTTGNIHGKKEEEMRSGFTHHRSDTNIYPYVDEELNESKNLELLRRYIYDPSSRTYKIQYIHEVSTRESRRSSGRQSLRASAADLHHVPSDRRHAPTSGGLDDSFLGTLADELRRQGQYDDRGSGMPRNISAPHLPTEYNKENARRYGEQFDYSPDTLKRLLEGFGTDQRNERPFYRQPPRPVVVRKPYAEQYNFGQPFRPLDSNIPVVTEEYASQALKKAREQRSASHAVVDPNAQSPDRSFDDRERLFERSERARQSFHSSSLRRGGVRHAIATRPDTDYNDDWDADSGMEERSRRSSAGGQGPGLLVQSSHRKFYYTLPLSKDAAGIVPIAQPRTIQPLRHTPSGLYDNQKIRPTDIGVQPRGEAPPTRSPWSTYPIQQERRDQVKRDLEIGYRPNEDQRPLQPSPRAKKLQKDKDVNKQSVPKNRKFPSFTKCCFYVLAPCLIIFVVAAVIITLIVIA